MITDISTIYVKSDRCIVSPDESSFTLEIDAPSDRLNKFTHCAITALSLNQQVFAGTDTDVIYMHADCVASEFGTIFGDDTGNKKVYDIIASMNVSDTTYNYFYESYELIANMKPYNGSNSITFRFTNSKDVAIILQDHCDFTFHLINFSKGNKMDRVLDKVEIFFDAIARANENSK